MKVMKTWNFLLCCLLCTALSACYDDKGNYDYNENINEIVIAPAVYTYYIPAAGKTETVVVSPTVTQTVTEGTDNLVYEWKQRIGGSWKVVGDGPSLTFQFTSKDMSVIELRYAVTDTVLGITTYAEISVVPLFKFEQSWFVLQDIDGQAVLGVVDGEGAVESRNAKRDILLEETGQSLVGKPVGIGVQPFMHLNSPKNIYEEFEILLGVFTDAKPYIFNGSSLEEHSRFNYQRLLYGKKATGDNTFDPWLMKAGTTSFVIIDNGKMWFATRDELGLMYPIRLAENLGEEYDYEATHVANGSNGNGYHDALNVIYDKKHHRFLSHTSFTFRDHISSYNKREEIVNAGGTLDDEYLHDDDLNEPSKSNSSRLEAIGINNQIPNAFDPNNLPGGFQLDFLGMESGDNILGIGHLGGAFQVYEFNNKALTGFSDEDACCSAAWTVPFTGDASILNGGGSVPVCTSNAFGRLFFYSDGHKVYKVDLNINNTFELYEAPEGKHIKMMKFKCESQNIQNANYGTDKSWRSKYISQSLGVMLENADGEATLVEMPLTVAGEIERDKDTKEQIIYEFDGTFRNVVDFVFSFRFRM